MTFDSSGYADPSFIEGYGDAWSSRDENVLSAYFAPDGVYVEGAMQAAYDGVAAVSRFFRYMLAFSSDSRVKFTSFIGERDAFAAEWLWWGTADGPLVVGDRRLEPTGAAYVVAGVAVCQIGPQGLVTYHKDYYDLHTLVAQVTGEQKAPDLPSTARSRIGPQSRKEISPADAMATTTCAAPKSRERARNRRARVGAHSLADLDAYPTDQRPQTHYPRFRRKRCPRNASHLMPRPMAVSGPSLLRRLRFALLQVTAPRRLSGCPAEQNVDTYSAQTTATSRPRPPSADVSRTNSAPKHCG